MQQAMLFETLNLNWTTRFVSPGLPAAQNSIDLKFAPL
jgi:hypothetical protein